MRKTLLVLLAWAALGLLGGCDPKGEAKAPSADAVVVVNGHAISRPIWDAYVKMRTGQSAKDLGATDKAKLLDDMIEMVLVADAPRKEDAAAKVALDSQVELTRLALNAQAQADELTKAEPTEAEIKAEYDSQLKLLAGHSEYLTRHIVVQSKEEGDALVAQLKKGTDFLKLAASHSTDAETKEGVVFWVGTSAMDQPFADAVRSLKKGDTAPAPVQSQFGWHVIRLEDTRPVTPPDYDGTKAQIKQALQQKKLRAAIDALKKTAKTEKRI
ncbi:MAG TPA: peptidyl-prolyl cis-trans isomerase [Steroidobacteraceae bacterium]|nr:peptidyl-prolyl cis-trans isomerase [Steroidobacteraceae bacterium]